MPDETHPEQTSGEAEPVDAQPIETQPVEPAPGSEEPPEGLAESLQALENLPRVLADLFGAMGSITLGMATDGVRPPEDDVDSGPGSADGGGSDESGRDDGDGTGPSTVGT